MHRCFCDVGSPSPLCFRSAVILEHGEGEHMDEASPKLYPLPSSDQAPLTQHTLLPVSVLIWRRRNPHDRSRGRGDFWEQIIPYSLLEETAQEAACVRVCV